MSDQQLQQQQPDPAAIVIPDDNPVPEPITIDLETGEADDAAPEQQAQPEAQKQPRQKQPARERVQQALRERDAERNMREQLQRELEEARRDATTARTEAATATRTGMENYAHRVKSEADAAQSELEQALKEGDAAAIAAANRKVAKVAAAEADVDAWRASQPADQPQQQPHAQPQAPQQQPQMVVPSEPTRQFFEENPWFHPLKLDEDGVPMTDRGGRPIANTEYDEDLHDAAMMIHKKIQRQVRTGKLPDDYIESAEYFAQIKSELAAQFPDDFADAEPAPQQRRATPPMQRAQQPVAPANRTSLPAAGRPAGGTKITLSGEERQFVDSMVANGAMRYPAGHKEAGRPMQPKDAYLEYAKQAQITRANQQQQ